MTELTRHHQNPECNMLFTVLSERLEKIEQHDKHEQDKEIHEIGKSLVKFELLFQSQNDTINKIMEEFTENRRENVKLHKEKDKVIQDLSKNITEISHSLEFVSKSQKDIIESIHNLSKSTKTSIEDQNKKIDEINRRDTISVVDTIKKALGIILTSMIGSGIVVFYLISKYIPKG